MARIYNVTYEQRFSYNPQEWVEDSKNVLVMDDDAQSAVHDARRFALADKGVLEAEEEGEKDTKWKCVAFRLVSVDLASEADIWDEVEPD